MPPSSKSESGALDNIDWNTDDELEVFGTHESLHPSFPPSSSETILCNGEASSSAGSSSSSLINQLLAMGFQEDLIFKAIEEHGKDSEVSALLETLLTYSWLEESPKERQGCKSPSEDSQAPYISADQQTCNNYDLSSSDYDESFLYRLSDTDSGSDNELEENSNCSSGKDGRVHSLVKMGYSDDEVSIALERCGTEASIAELADCIFAHQLATEQDLHLPDEVVKAKPSCSGGKLKKRKFSELSNKKKLCLAPEDERTHLPQPMVGFGLPSGPRTTNRELPKEALGPPYFYYENVASTPRGVWPKISKILYDVEPEFVDSKHFCVAARKRGYVHNLPIHNRFPLLPIPPSTIFDTFPLSRRWWPSWDGRKKLNCLLTVYASSRTPERIRKAVEDYDGKPPLNLQNFVLKECKKWNLVWVGKNKVAPLDPDEVESIMGFPKYHTRGGGTSTLDRYKCLGNSFQVDTVAYHLSPLKPLFPNGMNVLSLFSGIGGAEVALHRLGIRLKTVVSVEKSEISRTILRGWWEEKNLTGNLIEFEDVEQLTSKKLEELVKKYGGFDLVIGGSPCNNLAGGNRHSRHGLEGKDSALFFEYVRILKCVKDMMSQMQH